MRKRCPPLYAWKTKGRSDLAPSKDPYIKKNKGIERRLQKDQEDIKDERLRVTATLKRKAELYEKICK